MSWVGATCACNSCLLGAALPASNCGKPFVCTTRQAAPVSLQPRFCEYQIKRGGGAAADTADLLALGGEGGAQGVLQSKLAALQAEAQVQQSAATSSFEWRGQSHPVRHERVSVAKPALQASCQPLCMSMLGSI